MIHGLFIGCDYRGTSSQLGGCIADANNWRGRGHNPHGPQSPGELCEMPLMLIERDATKQNVVDAIKTIKSRCPIGGDNFGLITFSGHGTFRRGTDSGEVDGNDEAICCYDFLQGGLLWDNEIAALIAGAQMLLVTDCCHSHTLTRSLPVVVDSEIQPTPRYIPFDSICEGLLPCEVTKLCEGAETFREQARFIRGADGSIPGVIHLAGCLDNEYSYDASIGGKPTGAMSYYALDCYRRLPIGATYADWFTCLGLKLPTRSYPQHPQLTATAEDRARVVLGREQPSAQPLPPSQPGTPTVTGSGVLTLGGKTYDVRERT